ncbi:MAG TPA: PIG-L family deacetylase, partial [Rhodothermia bacterium]|nr:PIG-L family deacetylase [Rhodothermia bacterium]
ERAARILGTDVWFLNFPDFGYSKTATETVAHWGGRDEVLRRLVLVIRKLRPDVIITNHNTIDGHGHHQAAAIAAIEAFDAAADPSFHAEQFREEGISPWQTKKLYFRVFARDTFDVNEIESTGRLRRRNEAFSLNEYDVANPVFAEIQPGEESPSRLALRALREHKSQGMDKLEERRNPESFAYYRLVRESSMFAADSSNLFGGIDLSRSVSPSIRALRAEVLRLAASGPDSVEFSDLNRLIRRASGLLEDGTKSPWDDGTESPRDDGAISPLERRLVTSWRNRLNDLALLLATAKCSVGVSDSLVVRGEKVEVLVEFQPARSVGVDSLQISIVSSDGWRAATLDPWTQRKVVPGKAYRSIATILVPRDAKLTWPRAKHMYDSMHEDAAVTVKISFTVRGESFTAERPLHLDVAPVLSVEVMPKRVFFGTGPLNLHYRVRNYGWGKTAGRLNVTTPEGWFSENADFVIAHEDSSASGSIAVKPAGRLEPGTYRVVFDADWSSDTVSVISFPVNIPENLLVGIVESYDNTLETALGQLGIQYERLNAQDLSTGDLSRFHTVAVDIRAYLVRPDLVRASDRVLRYVHDGGNLVVFYQKDIEWKPEFAPYPVEIGHLRVSDESATVTILQPDHPLLLFPNRIVQEDWSGWVQERGLYFPDRHASQYTELLGCADPDEPALTSGYLVAQYGNGSYIYTSYSWYRQIREMNPGAIRNLVNMISQNVRSGRLRGD